VQPQIAAAARERNFGAVGRAAQNSKYPRAPIARGGPVPSSQAIYRKIIDLIENNQSADPRHRSARERVVDAFEDNVFTQRAVAKRLGLSVATLRRRLEIEGSPSFRVLNERALKRAARSLLEQRPSPE